MEQLLDERPVFDRPQPPRHKHRRRKQRRMRLRSRRAMAFGLGAALLGAGIAVGTKAVPMPLADAYGGQAPQAAILTTAPIPSQPGASAFGYTVASLPASMRPHATATKSTKPRPTPSMTQAGATASSTPSTASSHSAASSLLTPQPTAQNETPTGQNQKAWSEAILTALGAPLTSANIISIGYWMQNEAGSPPSGIVGENNPINVSQAGYNGTGIQDEGQGYSLMSYPTVADGVAATVAYLNNGSYGQIVSDLKQGVGLSGSDVADELSVYSGNGYTTIPDSWGASQGQPEG